MFKIDYFKMLMLFYIVMLMVAACNDDDDEQLSADEQAISALAGEWKAVKATKDDIDLPGYDNFILVITNKGVFQTYGDRNTLFPVGQFSFVEGSNRQVVLCDDVEVQLDLKDNSLTATFELYQDAGSGRVSALQGQYQFNLVREEEQ